MTLTLRQGTIEDSHTVFTIFRAALLDLGERQGMMTISGGSDPTVMAELWERRQPLFEHLARSAEQFWLAEADGEPVGYARAVLREGVRELTEFFVMPGSQSAGVGRALLGRAFAPEGVRRRTVIASPDVRALASYMRAGVYPHFPIYELARRPERRQPAGELRAEPMAGRPESQTARDALDRELLGYRRPADHAWWQKEREGLLFVRDGAVVGYGYVGYHNGPFALRDPADWPEALTLAEDRAAAAGYQQFSLDVPLVNRGAVSYLLGRGFRLEPFTTFLMSDRPFGDFQRYIGMSPSFLL